MSIALLLFVPALSAALSGVGRPADLPRVPGAAWVPDGLQAGDLVFRRGRTMHSRAVLLADQASPYSHVGMVVAIGHARLVAHAVPGAAGTPGGARIEPLARFLARDQAAAWAVLRPVGAAASRAADAARAALELAHARVPFDDGFDLADPSRLYCTELVWLAYRRAGIDLVDGRFDRISLPLGRDGPALLPSTLQKSPYLEPWRRTGGGGDGR